MHATRAEDIVTTTNHPFYVDGQGFIAAGDLKEGQLLSQWSGYRSPVELVGTRRADTTGHLLVKAVSITREGLKPWRAYNLSVENDHTFFVGNLGTWVHNANAWCGLVYVSKNANGAVQYVGITNDIARRQVEHLATKGIEIEAIFKTPISRADAKAVEQVLIEAYELNKNGGSLLNKINSIAKSNPDYAAALQRGAEILERIGYKP